MSALLPRLEWRLHRLNKKSSLFKEKNNNNLNFLQTEKQKNAILLERKCIFFILKRVLTELVLKYSMFLRLIFLSYVSHEYLQCLQRYILRIRCYICRVLLIIILIIVMFTLYQETQQLEDGQNTVQVGEENRRMFVFACGWAWGGGDVRLRNCLLAI